MDQLAYNAIVAAFQSDLTAAFVGGLICAMILRVLS